MSDTTQPTGAQQVLDSLNELLRIVERGVFEGSGPAQDRARTAIAAALSAPVQQAGHVLEGWRLVPITPTEAMKQAGYHAPAAPGLPGPYHVISIWDSMIAAAPQPGERG